MTATTTKADTRKEKLFRSVVGNSPATEIIGQIRSLLASQRLRAGDRLPSERELAEQFGVSRNSVRQALRSLQEQGLLEIRKGAVGGAFIQEGGGGAVLAGLSDLYSLGTIRPEHLTEVRVLIGVEVVRLACERCTDEEIDALERNVASAEEAARLSDFVRRTELNLEFHQMLARMTRNAMLIAITDAVVTITKQFVEKVGIQTPNSYVMPFRRRLLRQLRRRDSAAATAEMKRHLLQQEKLYLKAAAKNEVDFPISLRHGVH
jgi:GntR family transcriptional regulator, transcriptional repressor for pyruvate dehydrogenase complex